MRRLGALLLLAIACESPAQLVVVVDTDLAVPGELAMVRAVVLDREGQPRSLNDFVLDEEGAPELPFSFGVVPIDGDPARTISIELTAHDGARAELFTARARTGFVANRTLRLPMFLAGDCRTIECGENETCGEAGCVAADVPPETLGEVEPGEEL
jgi:hypothetical protein